MIALTVCLIAWMGYLRIKMFYGNYKVNKLTFRPFQWAAFALVFKVVGQLLYLTFAPVFIYYFENDCLHEVLYSWRGQIISFT